MLPTREEAEKIASVSRSVFLHSGRCRQNNNPGVRLSQGNFAKMIDMIRIVW